MGKGYRHISDTEREQIERWLGEGVIREEIARRLLARITTPQRPSALKPIKRA